MWYLLNLGLHVCANSYMLGFVGICCFLNSGIIGVRYLLKAGVTGMCYLLNVGATGLC